MLIAKIIHFQFSLYLSSPSTLTCTSLYYPFLLIIIFSKPIRTFFENLGVHLHIV